MEGQSKCRTLEELFDLLDVSVFWRAHRSYVVNINHIKEVVPWFKSSYQLRMADRKHTEIPVSRAQTKRLRELSFQSLAGCWCWRLRRGLCADFHPKNWHRLLRWSIGVRHFILAKLPGWCLPCGCWCGFPSGSEGRKAGRAARVSSRAWVQGLMVAPIWVLMICGLF